MSTNDGLFAEYEKDEEGSSSDSEAIVAKVRTVSFPKEKPTGLDGPTPNSGPSSYDSSASVIRGPNSSLFASPTSHQPLSSSATAFTSSCTSAPPPARLDNSVEEHQRSTPFSASVLTQDVSDCEGAPFFSGGNFLKAAQYLVDKANELQIQIKQRKVAHSEVSKDPFSSLTR